MLRKGLLALFLISVVGIIYAQNVQNIDVNFLSDQQIIEYWDRARSEGYSIDQVKSVAMSRGMSTEQADLLVKRIKDLDLDADTPGATSGSSVRNLSNSGVLNDFLTGDENEIDLTPFERKLFGYRIFQVQGLGFAPNFNKPTPENYVLGPGDEVLIEIYGASQNSYELIVNPEGKILVPLLGPVHVGAMTIEEANQKLKSSLSTIYRGLSTQNPTVFMDLTLGDIRSLRINVVGEVKKPGVYAVPSFASVFNIMYAAGGPTVNGTFRNIRIYRSGKQIRQVDLYDYLTNGMMSESFQLNDDDLVVVGPFESRVEVIGEVKLPGIFEVKKSESLNDIINLAGGFSAKAHTKSVTLERLVGSDQLVKDLATDNSDFQVEDGDNIIVREAIDPLVKKIQVEGAVLHPGAYGWNEDLGIEDLLAKAGGLLPEAYLKKTTLFRRQPDQSTKVENIDLSNILDEGAKFTLQQGDLLIIPNLYELSEAEYIEVSGEVISPSVIPYFEGMTLADALLLTSGIRNAALGGSIELISQSGDPTNNYSVNSIDLPEGPLPFEDESLQIPLKVFDHVFVRKAQEYQLREYVEIIGEVNAPGKFLLTDRETRVADIVERGKGLTDYAFLNGVYILRRNSSWSSIQESRRYLQRLGKLNDFLNKTLAGGTLSEVERRYLNKRIGDLKDKYENRLRNEGSYESDSLLNLAVDSVLLDPIFGYDRIAISAEEVKGIGNNTDEFILRDGDRIYVPTRPQTIRISGSVLKQPTVARYSSSKSFGDYIGDAGGYNQEAKRSKAYVLYANGEAAKTTGFLFFRNRPEIMPGCEIIIPDGRRREQFNIDRIFSLVTTAATTYLLILTVQDRVAATN